MRASRDSAVCREVGWTPYSLCWTPTLTLNPSFQSEPLVNVPPGSSPLQVTLAQRMGTVSRLIGLFTVDEPWSPFAELLHRALDWRPKCQSRKELFVYFTILFTQTYNQINHYFWCCETLFSNCNVRATDPYVWKVFSPSPCYCSILRFMFHFTGQSGSARVNSGGSLQQLWEA